VRFYFGSSLKKNKEVELTSQAVAQSKEMGLRDGRIDIEGKAKEAKRKREISLLASMQKLWYLRGAKWNGTKTKNWRFFGSV
jgi:hypothetical protein